MQTNGSFAFANALITSGYADNIAVLALPAATSRHYAQATFHVVAGYSPNNSHECELLTGFTIAPHVAKGYECLWPIGAAYPIWVRWNGDIANFTYAGASDDNLGTRKSWPDSSTDTFVGAPRQGDVFRVVYDASSGSPVLTAYLNGVRASTITDTSSFKIVSGRPGVGFFVRSGGTPQNYCYDAFEGGVL